MVAIHRDLKIDKRVIKQLSESAIKKDPVRALVELITNCDDSYRRLESNGLLTTGKITIEIIRKQNNSVFRVIDHAEGFDAETMDERVGGFGSNTSGLTEGIEVRGFFGRGLKEAILGLGSGSVVSIKNGLLYQCSLNKDAIYYREDPVKISNALRTELGINENGSIIEITVTKDDVRVPQFDTFIFQLERYFSLREINSSTKRQVYLIEKDHKGKSKKEPIRLEYAKPLGKEVLSKKTLPLNGYKGAEFDIQIFEANDPLSQDGLCREGGILIKGKTAIHDIKLFKFESNPYAQKIFGTVRCKFIDDLIKQEEPVISDRRDGLDWSYPFCKTLQSAIEEELKSVVEEIKKKEEGAKKQIENERTRQRFKSAVDRINQIAKKELGEEGEGKEAGKEKKAETPPPNGFDFIPEYYHLVAGRRATLTLKAVIPWILKNGSVISIESDKEDISIETRVYTVKQEEANEDGIVKFNPVIHGKRVGSEAVITARSTVDGRSFRAEALVKVVADLEKRDKHKKRKGQDSKGLISDIQFDPTLGTKVRHYFEAETGVIKISSKHPSVEVYLGPAGEGQDNLHCQVLIAELVTDAFIRELARRKAESGKLLVLGERMDAINRERDQLINEYAHVIHQSLVAPEARRKLL